MLREFKEYRPYANLEQFKRELGKYVGADQVAQWQQYVFVPTNPNTVTVAQLTGLKGVDKAIADYIVAGRSYKDWAALRLRWPRSLTPKRWTPSSATGFSNKRKLLA